MAKADSRPGFPVAIARPFMIGKYEVTQAQWKKCDGQNPSISREQRSRTMPGRHPVDNVTWDDAQAFMKKLNALERTNVYRLPTEFEWEYRGASRRHRGHPVARYGRRRSRDTTRTPAHTSSARRSRMPGDCTTSSAMSGSGCRTPYNGDLFADPRPSTRGPVHVLKGGGFAADVKNAIPAMHAGGPGSGFDVGLRIVREIERPTGLDARDSRARRR